MKNLIKRLKRQAQAYIDFRAQPAADINLKTHKIITTIKEAQEKQLALHAIYKDGSFTGDLVKYDPKNDKVILKNFQKKITTIRKKINDPTPLRLRVVHFLIIITDYALTVLLEPSLL